MLSNVITPKFALCYIEIVNKLRRLAMKDINVNFQNDFNRNILDSHFFSAIYIQIANLQKEEENGLSKDKGVL